MILVGAGDIVLHIITKIIRMLKLYKIAGLFLSKEQEGYYFWKLFVKDFKSKEGKLLEYWNKYRCFEDIRKIVPFSKDSEVLDIGGGICSILLHIQCERYILDPLINKLKKLYDYPASSVLINGYGETVPYSSEYFDVVFCSNALDHTDKPEKVVHEAHRVLKQNGYFILTVEIGGRRNDPAHPHQLSRNDVEKLTEGFGCLFKKEMPFIGIKGFLNGNLQYNTNELIMVLQKNG
jgi:SAM-dependent methyltransferase